MSYQVSEASVRGLLDRMGYNVQGLDSAKLQKKMSSFPECVKSGEPLTNTDDLNLRDEILEVLGRGEQIELTTQVAVAVQTETTVAVLEMPTGALAPESTSNGSHAEATPSTTTSVSTTPAKRGRKPKAASTATSSATSTHKTPQAASKAPKTVKAAHPPIFGQSPILVARWLGYKGFKLNEAKPVLAHYGVVLKDDTLRTYLTDGKRPDEKYGKKAVLTAEQEAELMNLKPVLQIAPEPAMA